MKKINSIMPNKEKTTVPTNSKTDVAPDAYVIALRDLKNAQLGAVPDFRGWAVKAGDGAAVGSVARLYMDKKDHTLRYVAVQLDPELAPPSVMDKGLMLVPVGRAQLHPQETSSCCHR